MLIAQQQTAIDAFYGHQTASHQQRMRIVAFIAARGGDWSIGEIAKAIDLEKSTVSARLNECLKAGELVEKPKRIDRCSGIRIRPVALPAKQLSIFDGGAL